MLQSLKHQLHRTKKIDFIEQFNEKLLVKQVPPQALRVEGTGLNCLRFSAPGQSRDPYPLHPATQVPSMSWFPVHGSQGLRFTIYGSQGLGFRVHGSQSIGFRVHGSQGLGFRL